MPKNIGDELLATDFAQLGAQQTGDGTNVVSFTNTAIANGTPIVGFALVVPASGRIMLSINVGLSSTGAAQAFAAAALRTGTTVGSGTLIVDPLVEPNARCGVTTGTYNMSAMQIVEGLTPGAFLNANVVHYVAAGGTGTLFHRRIDMVPLF